MSEYIDWLHARREYDLEQQKIEYERELQEELEDDWAEDRLRITGQHILEALGISLGSATIPFTDDQLDDGVTQEELEPLVPLTCKQWAKLQEIVIADHFDKSI